MAPECTFLGPSRKRGPPKGYIDAIEARLHQTEAVLGIILSLAGGLDGSRGPGDPGAGSLIEDLCQVCRLFRNQFPSLSLCTDKPSITGSTCPLHPPSRRGDTLRFKVEGKTAYRPAVEIEAARLFGYFGTVSSLPPVHQSSLTSVPFPFLPNHSTAGIIRFGSEHQTLAPPPFDPYPQPIERMAGSGNFQNPGP